MQEQEFFRKRSPKIANAPNQAVRSRLIDELNSMESTPDQKRLFREFLEAKRKAESLNLFMRHSGRYPLTSRGKINTYAVFSETFLHLLNSRGRAGFIVPTGIATDSSTQIYFRNITTNLHLISLMDFENREKLFSGVHASFKFSLLTLGSNFRNPTYSFFAKNIDDLRNQNRTFELSREDIQLLNPNTRTTPIFRSRMDAEITKNIYRRMALIWDQSESADHRQWSFKFRQMFNMASDSGLFRTYRQLEQLGASRKGTDWVEGKSRVWSPLMEAKMFHQYDHRWRSYKADGSDPMIVSVPEKQDPEFEPMPRYWVNRDEISDRMSGRTREQYPLTISRETLRRPPLHSNSTTQDDNRIFDADLAGEHDSINRRCCLAFRKVARSTDERTSIMALVPGNGMSDGAPVVRFANVETEALMVSVFNSFVFDYCTRNAIGGTALSHFIIYQLPIPRPKDFMQTVWPKVTYKDFIIPRVLELTYTSWSLQPVAVEIGYNGPPFQWSDERRFLMKCELDAAMFHIYGLTIEELCFVLETFPIVKRNDHRRYQEYRTKRVICEVFTDMLNARTCGTAYQSRLVPSTGLK